MKIVVALTLACKVLLFLPIQAQTKIEDEYRIESEKMRKIIWAWKDPKFKVHEIPAVYGSSSKVIIAHHVELNAEGKSKNIVFFSSKINTQNVSEIIREVIKLNDKNAVTSYSEISFTQFLKSSGFNSDQISSTMIGVRVIKPNGVVQEIDADDVVLTEKSNKSMKAKLAIPDLQPGDIIDYYVANVTKSNNDFSSKQYVLKFFDDAPIMSYSFHGELGKKYGLIYQSYNGAPKFKLGTNDEENIVFDIANKDMQAFETNLWISVPRQLPFIRFNIYLPLFTRKPGEIVEVKDNIKAYNSLWTDIYSERVLLENEKREYKHISSEAIEAVYRSGKEYKNLSLSEQSEQQYYTFRFHKILPFDIANFSNSINLPFEEFNGASVQLLYLLDVAGIKANVIASDYRLGYRFSEAMQKYDFQKTTYIPEIDKYLSIESIFDLPFQVPVELEGAKESTIIDMKKIKGQMGPKVPISNSGSNARIEKYSLKLLPEKNGLEAKRHTTLKGYYKIDLQRALVLYEDYYEQERLALGEKKSILEVIEESKNGKLKAEEVRNAFAEARKKQKEAFLKDAMEWLGQDIVDQTNTTIHCLGVRNTNPDFIYSSSFNINGMVKKAGNNCIVEIGKILGEPLKVKEDQRNRNLDIYMPFARSIEYEIALDIPDGFSAEGVNALNVNVNNETGFFIAEATTSDKQVIIKIKKHYLHNFEPAANFDKLNEFMDAASAWTDSKLLFKKK